VLNRQPELSAPVAAEVHAEKSFRTTSPARSSKHESDSYVLGYESLTLAFSLATRRYTAPRLRASGRSSFRSKVLYPFHPTRSNS